MKVTAAAAPSSATGVRGGSSTCAGQGVRRVSNIRGTAENGWPAAPVRLTNRSAVKVVALRGRHRAHLPAGRDAPPT